MYRFASRDIKYLKGVGESRAKLLDSELEIKTFRDLLYYFPFKYIDRTRFYQIDELTADMSMVQIKGYFISFRIEGEGAKKRLIGIFSDGKKMMEVVWFSKIKQLSSLYRTGEEYTIFGKPNLFRNVWSMVHPEVEKPDNINFFSGLRGIYSLTEKLRNCQFSARTISTLVQNIIKSPIFENVEETLPERVVAGLHLMPLRDALINMHFPTSQENLRKAKERLKFEELFYVELHILRFARQRSTQIPGLIFHTVGKTFDKFYSEVLPFELTSAQKRVLKEIRNDMRKGCQMNRLLQGDVGCGKTLVAFMSMLISYGSGFQSCLMAPTEILATQHFETLREWGSKIGVRVELLTGNTRTSTRKEIHSGLLDGSIHILVGTHALIEDPVRFKNLGLAVIDEQHRFGVMQRAKLWKKNTIAPHVLVMTATPIPRTLAMTVYGDLDVSVIDELPPGRKPITTFLRFEEERQSVYRMIGKELSAGRQIYIVYPLIHENEKLSLKSLEEGYKKICDVFDSYKVCFVHGQMKPAEKDFQMNMFVRGEAHIMVATTVIEVGVNVPNASVMIIENAERFGLSQLHQLRGRVGRGADQSYCILMSKPSIGKDTRKRLTIMTESTDGFLISEADMKLRGPGDMEGTQQSGLAFNLKVADLARDGQIIQIAREEAQRILDGNPELVIAKSDSTQYIAVQTNNINKLSLKDKSIIQRELALRFSHTYDWSRIS